MEQYSEPELDSIMADPENQKCFDCGIYSV